MHNKLKSYLNIEMKKTKFDIFQIKTLKLAILYIKYLVEVLDGDQDPKTGFRADLKPSHRKNSHEKRNYIKYDSKVRGIYDKCENVHNLFVLH